MVEFGGHTWVTVHAVDAVGDQALVDVEGLPVEPLGHVVVTVSVCVNVLLSELVRVPLGQVAV